MNEKRIVLGMNEALDLNLLRVLDALMRRRSVTGAASELGLTQAATSNALARLRRVTGDRLLERQGNAMVPTRTALDLWPGIADGLSRIGAAVAASGRFDPASASGRYRVGMHGYALELLGPPLAAALAQTAPGMTLELRLAGDPAQDEMLRDGGLDLILRASARPAPGMMRQQILSEDFVGLAAEGHPVLQPGRTPSLDAWLAHPHVLVSTLGRTTGNVDMALDRTGRARRIGCTVPGFDAAAAVAAASGMVLSAPRRLAAPLAARHGLCVFDLPLGIDGFDLVMLWMRRDDPAPAHRWLRGLIAGLDPSFRRQETPV